MHHARSVIGSVPECDVAYPFSRAARLPTYSVSIHHILRRQPGKSFQPGRGRDTRPYCDRRIVAGGLLCKFHLSPCPNNAASPVRRPEHWWWAPSKGPKLLAVREAADSASVGPSRHAPMTASGFKGSSGDRWVEKSSPPSACEAFAHRYRGARKAPKLHKR